MMVRKMTAMLICAILLTAILTGCTQTEKSPFVSDDPAASASPSSDASAVPTAIDIAGAYASVDPSTVMLTVNGENVTWEMFFYYVNATIYDIQSQGYIISNLSDIYMDGVTYKDYILDTATNITLQYAAIKYGAEQLQVSLSDADKEAVQASWDERVTSAGSEEAFVAQLQENYCTKDLFMELMGMRYLFSQCFNSMYGEDGSKLSDEEVADYTAEDGYLMAKHILMMTKKTDDAGTETTMTDTEKAEVYAKMEDILNQLKSYDGDDFDTFFDELMNNSSEDPGKISYPDGYLFQDGDMVTAFYDTTSSLEIGAFSDIIESEFGYHIIYRLPINYDVTPIAMSNSTTYTLRLLTAQNMFSAVADTWMNSLEVAYSDQYNALDLEKLFAVG